MQRVSSAMIAVAFGIFMLQAQSPLPENTSKEEQGYHIDKPGTITFTVGIKIKGKVEKPQVVIFLPKEKPVYREVILTHSFYNDLTQPLPLKPDDK